MYEKIESVWRIFGIPPRGVLTSLRGHVCHVIARPCNGRGNPLPDDCSELVHGIANLVEKLGLEHRSVHGTANLVDKLGLEHGSVREIARFCGRVRV